MLTANLFGYTSKDTSVEGSAGSTSPINNETFVIVESNIPSQQPKLIPLNLKERLSNIRKELLKEDIINDNSFFLIRYSEDKFAEIIHNKEQNMTLNNITYKNINNEYILYVRLYPDWKYFNHKYKLEYGYIKSTDEIKKVEKKAFVIKNCALTETDTKECTKKEIKYNSKEDKMLKTSLFSSGDVNINKFVNLGISFGKTKNSNSNLDKTISHNCADYGKAYLKFNNNLEPTSEFVEAVNDAITSRDPQKLVNITEDFGQFIPTRIFLGGRAYYENIEVSAGQVTEDNKEISTNVNVAGYLNIKGSYAPKSSEKKANQMNFKYTTIIGGDLPKSLNNFDEKAWIQSLNADFRTWDIIEHQDIISIFQPLPNELRTQIRELVGKKILHFAYKEIIYQPDSKTLKVELKEAPSEILNIIGKKDADYNIFATITDTGSKNKDVFTCRVLRPTNEAPSILVSRIKDDDSIVRQPFKLKIGWMVIGYPDCIYLDEYRLTVMKVNFEGQGQNNHKTKILFNCKHDPYSGQLPLLGIPVVNKLNLSNDCLAIGHHFFFGNEDNKIGACVYCYNVEKRQYVGLPPFTFDVLVIRSFDQSIIDCGVTPLISSFNKSPHFYFLKCDCPKFISPISDYAIGTIYLEQNNELIQVKYPPCSKKCQICSQDKQPSEDVINCTIFDPRKT